MAYTYTLERLAGHTIEEYDRNGGLVPTDLILIGVDEYCLGFGGGGNNLISALEGEKTYENAQNVPPVRFKLTQWGAACSKDIPGLKQPIIIWEPESHDILRPCRRVETTEQSGASKG